MKFGAYSLGRSNVLEGYGLILISILWDCNILSRGLSCTKCLSG